MRRSNLVRIIALVLVISLLPVNVSAASWNGGAYSSRWSDFLDDLMGRLWGSQEEEETEPVETTVPVETETPAEDSDYVLVPIENEDTVENGNMLRATTYALTAAADDGTATADATVVYYPVTMYNYNADTINAATHQAEVDAALAAGETLTAWYGMYFNGGEPEVGSYSYESDNSVTIANGYKLVVPEFDSDGYITNLDTSKEYIFVNKRGSQAIYDNNSSSNSAFKRTSVVGGNVFAYTSNVTEWTLTAYGDGYRIKSNRSTSDSYYMVIGNGKGYTERNGSAVTYIKQYSGDAACVTLSQSSYGTTYYMNHYGGTDGSTFAGYSSENDEGAAFYIYEVATNIEVNEATTEALPYAPHNVWTNKIFDSDSTYGSYSFTDFGKLSICTGAPTDNKPQDLQYTAISGSTSRAGYIYNGLVQNRLDANKDIVFTVPDGGIFNDDATVKSIYTNVGLPFQKNGTTYTFDASTLSAKFDGTPTSNTDLVSSGDGQFWPFGSSETEKWHFGMNATVPFTMTVDGTLTGEGGEDIVFDFAGDDDVWVFVDGILVLDIGGIHNSVSGSMNFAENTTSVFSTATNIPSGYINTTDGAVEGEVAGYLFDEYDANGTKTVSGVLGQTIETFAAKDYHELTVFYLERGKGVSNCKISFNLPVKDTLSVQKIVDKAADFDSNGKLVEHDLTAAQKAVIDNMDFGFTLYNGENKAVAGETYILLNANGQVVGTPSTDANGHFTLKNGQTAKFVGEFSTSGEGYYVVEDIKNGFIYTTYTATGACAGGWSGADVVHEYGDETSSTDGSEHYYVTDLDYTSTVNGKTYTGMASSLYTVTGGAEAEDTLAIVAKNYLNYTLPTPTALPDDDKIVIDYGLPVVIDLFSNDYVLGNSWAITFGSTEGKYGTFTYADGKITYTLNKQLTGVEVIPYTLTATAVGSDGTPYTDTHTANVYIIPATTMYYEENFGLVTYQNGSSGGWTSVGSAQNGYQEPGVVGTPGDSPYGSDVAYLDDSGDSNGTSQYVNTTTGAARFVYTFTGTGTSFYVRTSNTSGYMQVKITDKDGNLVTAIYRDTFYNDAGSDIKGTLYNIPVYTWNAVDNGLDYGTYTVTVTIAKQSNVYGYHNEFWLDGIRVFEPLDSTDANDSMAQSAYATDGEANMMVETLRDKLIADADVDDDGNIKWNDTDKFVLFTDTNGQMQTAEQYESIGPKEEVYLYNGQSITFSLTGDSGWDSNTNHLYIGLKAPTGSATVTIGSTTLELTNTADCYFDVSDYATVSTVNYTDEKGNVLKDADGNPLTYKVATVTITAGAGDLVSVTNIKVTGSAEFTIIPGTDSETGAEGGDPESET